MKLNVFFYRTTNLCIKTLRIQIFNFLFMKKVKKKKLIIIQSVNIKFQVRDVLCYKLIPITYRTSLLQTS